MILFHTLLIATIKVDLKTAVPTEDNHNISEDNCNGSGTAGTNSSLFFFWVELSELTTRTSYLVCSLVVCAANLEARSHAPMDLGVGSRLPPNGGAARVRRWIGEQLFVEGVNERMSCVVLWHVKVEDPEFEQKKKLQFVSDCELCVIIPAFRPYGLHLCSWSSKFPDRAWTAILGRGHCGSGKVMISEMKCTGEWQTNIGKALWSFAMALPFHEKLKIEIKKRGLQWQCLIEWGNEDLAEYYGLKPKFIN